MPGYKYAILTTEEGLSTLRLASRIHMRSKGLTQAAFAQDIGITQPTLRVWCEVPDEKASTLTGDNMTRLLDILLAEKLITKDCTLTAKAHRIVSQLEKKGVVCGPSSRTYNKKKAGRVGHGKGKVKTP